MASVSHPRFEEVVDQFELNWSDSSRQQISLLLAEVGLSGDASVAVELIRIDIQRRYAASLPVDLSAYLSLVPSQEVRAEAVRDRAEAVRDIAYEDFRTRRAFGQPCLPERWKEILGVESESWYRELVGSPEFNGSTHFMEEGSESTELDDGQSPQLLVESVIRGIGFTPVRQIGQGAFSRVFLARQQSLANRYVVVKAVQRSFEEADRLAELQHTNIVPIYSFHRSGSWSLLCMPYAGLVTLADYFDAIPDSNLRSGQSFVSTIQCARDITVQATHNQATNNQATNNQATNNQATDNQATDTAGGWSAQQTVTDENKRQRFESVSETLTPLHRDALALWFFSRIADALHHAHVRGILHGDIKPANLLIRNDGEPALLDFNLSQKFDDVEPEVVGGTLPYMSPETMRSLMGFDSHITVASDIYSLGVVLYQFLTGRLAYPPPRSAASIDLEVAIAQRESHIVWAESDKVSPAIQAIVEKCLARSVTQRYLSAEQLHDDLERERWNLPLKHARERSHRHRIRKWIARHPRATSAASVMAVAAAIIMTMTLVVWKVAASNERLVAARTFHRFEADARNSSAQLLSIGRTGKANAVEKARLCLATYGVLDDEKWQEANAWRYLADADKATSLSLMTNLMLKISWSHIDSDAVSATETIDTSELEKSTALKSISLLTQEPFVSHAPLAIGLLRHSANKPTDLQFLPPRLIAESIRGVSLTPLDRVGLAARYVEQGNGEAAYRLLPASLIREIDEYTYWITLGRTQLLLSDLRGAELSFSLALESHSASAAAFHYRGVCRMKMRNESDTRKALADFSSALERQPDAFESLTNRVMAREVLGDLKGAATDLKTLIDRNPNDAQALIIQSRVYRKQGDMPRADQALEAALRSRPSTVSGWVSLALARLPSDKHGALGDLLHAQQLSPNSVEVLQNLAHVYSEHLDDPEKANASLNRLLEINPEFEPAMLGRAVLHARGGNGVAAIKDLDHAVKAKGKLSPSSHYQAACVFALLLTHSNTEQEIARYRNNAFRYLSTALQQGYGADVFESDPDLAALRDDVRFQSALSIIRAGRGL